MVGSFFNFHGRTRIGVTIKWQWIDGRNPINRGRWGHSRTTWHQKFEPTRVQVQCWWLAYCWRKGSTRTGKGSTESDRNFSLVPRKEKIWLPTSKSAPLNFQGPKDPLPPPPPPPSLTPTVHTSGDRRILLFLLVADFEILLRTRYTALQKRIRREVKWRIIIHENSENTPSTISIRQNNPDLRPTNLTKMTYKYDYEIYYK